MMRVRPIRANEVALFAGLTGDAKHVEHVHDYLQQMFDAGTMRPEWCFVAHDASGRLVGRVAFWTLPGLAHPLDIVLLDVDWQEAEYASGKQLLDSVLKDARELGATTIGYALDDPPTKPHYQHHLTERLALLHAMGFELVRATLRFESPGDPPAAAEQRLNYRSITEVGEEAFLAAIADVSDGTSDQRILADRARLGPDEHAREMLTDLQRLEYEPDWWRLAYAPAGELVGLIMPASNFVFGIVGYIGVVPAQRGHGYVHTLLTEISAILHAAGYQQIRADTDVGNVPMANAFRRAGWHQFAIRRELEIELVAPRA